MEDEWSLARRRLGARAEQAYEALRRAREPSAEDAVLRVGIGALEVQVVGDLMGLDPPVHLRDEVRVVAAAMAVAALDEPPLGEAHRLVAGSREAGVPPQAVLLVEELAPALRRAPVVDGPALVVDVHADVVDVRVSGVCLGGAELALAVAHPGGARVGGPVE